MKSFAWRSLLVLVLAVALTSIVSDANAARRSSLAGNQFINDPDDMYAFPQLMAEYKNRVILQFADEDNGDGSVTFGDNSIWQFNTGRSDYLNNTAYWAGGGTDRGMPFSGGFNGLPGYNDDFRANSVEWWDIGYAREIGDNPWGFNLSWATDSNKITPDGTDPTSDYSTSMISLQVGATFGSTELAAEFGTGSFKDKLNSLDPSDQNDYGYFNFALLARGNLTGGGQNWRWVAAYANGSTSPKEADAVKLSSSSFRGSFGPVWGTPGQWEAAAYMSFTYEKNDMSNFSDPTLKSTGTYTGFPSYNMAMEYYINTWLVARGGIVSHNSSDKMEIEVTGGGKDETTGREYELVWTAGVGVDKGEWGLDLALEEENLHSGYVFNGDVGGDVFGYISAWLAW